jgi:hypothetical protein
LRETTRSPAFAAGCAQAGSPDAIEAYGFANGGVANDYPYGGNGNDRLIGGIGNDYLEGGNGADIFVFGENQSGHDTIADFVSGEDHHLEIKQNLNANNLLTAADVIAAATADASGNTVLHLGGQNDVVLLGVTAQKTPRRRHRDDAVAPTTSSRPHRLRPDRAGLYNPATPAASSGRPPQTDNKGSGGNREGRRERCGRNR